MLTATIAPDKVHRKKLIMPSWNGVPWCPTAARGIAEHAPQIAAMRVAAQFAKVP
jgi:hypothetical protein